MIRPLIGLWVASSIAATMGTAHAQIKDQVLALTNNKPTRIAWSRAVGGLTTDYRIVFGSGTYRVMSYSTTTDQVSDVLGSAGAFYRVKISHDGSRILYNSGSDLYMVDWSGSNNRLILRNAALNATWFNASSGKEYVFVSRGTNGTPSNMAYWDTNDPLWRICLTDTTDKLRITVPSNYAGIWLSVSTDGTRLGGHFPWTGEAGGGGILRVATTGSTSFTSFNVYGCWGMTPPDNSYRFLLYDNDNHNSWAVFNADGSGKRIVNIRPPGITTGTYNARMSVNNPQFFTLIAPMGRSASDFSSSVGLYLGKVDEAITSVQGWVKIAGSGECMGSAWIDPGSSPTPPVLALSTTQLSFAAIVGGTNPDTRTVTVSNGGGGTLSAVSAVSNATWLTVTREGSGNSQILTNAVRIAGLTAGTHTATVTVQGGGASNTLSYMVTLTLSVEPARLVSIDITPVLDSVAPMGSRLLTARCKDQRGNPFPALITWSVSGGGTLSRVSATRADSIDTTSFRSNGTLGRFKIIATSSQIRDTAEILVTASMSYLLTLGSPLGDRDYQVGDTMRVQWNASSNISGVMVNLSPDGGLSWYRIPGDRSRPFSPTDPEWGNLRYVIPATLLADNGATVSIITSEALVEVRGYFNEASDESDRPFSIRPRATHAAGPSAVGHGNINKLPAGPTLYDIRGRQLREARKIPKGIVAARYEQTNQRRSTRLVIGY